MNITLAEVKRQIGIPEATTVYDSSLMGMLEAAYGVAEGHVGEDVRALDDAILKQLVLVLTTDLFVQRSNVSDKPLNFAGVIGSLVDAYLTKKQREKYANK